MTRDEAIKQVLEDIGNLTRHGNGAPMRDGSHTREYIAARIKGAAEMIAMGYPPYSTLNMITLAADLAKLTIEELIDAGD